ncbi:methylenetetrahydrofolate reductase [Futiania mangrovi]|uniref:Methylenetetrahydrofolate reductase n=1 Tax=Futiania mangrovi TaxID=2959716 RepID=A0A9J6P8E1_9PROT|nr:methylenetetrahydrofolate reductase [Futiania mangrovii]MCP1335924.1 methylenetetrahydrofolate reductase [Futiania mangrovii]
MTTPAVRALLQSFTIEVTPKQIGQVPDLRDLLPRGTTVYVAHIEGTPFAEMLGAARRLVREGFCPRPHIPARLLDSEDQLREWARAYAGEAGVSSALCIAGGIERPRGPFADSMAVLETGALSDAGIRTVAVAGHPEGNRDIGEEGIAAALAWKNAYAECTGDALSITTQFCFEAAPCIAWAERLRAGGNRLPIDLGVAGPAKLSTLIKYATMCGIGPSMRVLTRQARNMTKLMSVAGPDAFVGRIAEHVAETPASAIRRLHFFPLGGLRQTAEWIAGNRGGLHAQPLDNARGTRQVA